MVVYARESAPEQPAEQGESAGAAPEPGSRAYDGPDEPPGRSPNGKPASPRVPSGGFRGDIEGLRAIAVGSVLLYHAGLPFLPGGFVGVDVFFVISGFLITTQLVSELGRTGTVSLARFYARRAKRLLPAAGVVLLVSALLVRFFVPKTRWQEIGGDIFASALYVVNWRLADRSVDYLAEDSQPSPVQHFWSLAVEEQYYLVWPLLILAAVLAAKVVRRQPRLTLWGGLALVVIPSFAWSVIQTAHAPAHAFFETTTRMWELGIGAAVALAADGCRRLPRMWAIAIGWYGIAAIVASAALFTTEAQWPGYAAALPTSGAATVIMAGFAAARGGPASLLAVRPLRWVGGLSYSLYLWHWPLLVAATTYLGGLSPSVGLIVVVASVVPAWLTYRYVENPIRHSAAVSRSSRLALSLGANFTLVGVTVGLALLLAVATAPTTGSAAQGNAALGAAGLRTEPRDDPAGAPVDEVAWMTPLPTQATADIPRAHAEGCQQTFAKSAVVTCEYGDQHGRLTVAVVGDSKMTQWTPALELIAEQNGWRLVTYLKSSCSFSLVTTVYDGKPYQTCRDWAEDVLDRLVADPPDYVLTTQGASEALTSGGKLSAETMAAGLRQIWSTLTAKGSKVVVIADNPHPGMNVYECVERNPQRLSVCAFDRERYALSAAPVQHRAAKGQRNVRVVDLFDAICPTDRCAPVIGNVLVYRQGSHITATYAKTLTPRLAAALSKAGLPAAYNGEGK